MTGQRAIRYHKLSISSPSSAKRGRFVQIVQPQSILWLILFVDKSVLETMIRLNNNATDAAARRLRDGGMSRDYGCWKVSFTPPRKFSPSEVWQAEVVKPAAMSLPAPSCTV